MLKKCSLNACDYPESVFQVDIWSLRRYALPTSSATGLSNSSGYRGINSVKHAPSAVVTVVGQLQPLVHGRAGLPRPPPPIGGGTGGTGNGSDDTEALLLQQRRRSPELASTSTVSAATDSRSPPGPPTQFGESRQALDLAAASLWDRPSHTALLGLGHPVTVAQAAVQLLRIADQGPATAAGPSLAAEVQPGTLRVAGSSQGALRRSLQQEQRQQLEAAGEEGQQLEAEGAEGQQQQQELMASLDQLALLESLEVVQPLLPALSVTQLQRCLEALAAVKHTPTDPWFHDWVLASERLLDTADATEVYGMLIAMRVLRLRPQSPGWVGGAVAALSAHLPQLDAVQAVELLGCFADMALLVPDGLIARIFLLLLPDLPQLQPRVLIDLLSSCRRLCVTPPAHVLAAAFSALTPAVLAAAPPAALCRLAAAMSGRRLQPPLDLLASMAARVDALLRCTVSDAGGLATGWGSSGPTGGGNRSSVAEPMGSHAPAASAAAAAAAPGDGPGLQQTTEERAFRPRKGTKLRRGAATPGPAATTPTQDATAGAPSSSPSAPHVPSPAINPSDAGMATASTTALATLTAAQLSRLLRDLRALQAPLRAEWGLLCGRFLIAQTGSSTPVVDVLYVLREAARCGLALPPPLLRVVLARVEASLCAASEQRRRQWRRRRQRRRRRRMRRAVDSDSDSDMDPEVYTAGSEEGPETSAEEEDSTERLGAEETTEGRTAAAATDESRAGKGAVAEPSSGARTELSQWTPQVFSVAARALVPYAVDLPPTLLSALYDNLYDSLESFDLPELTATLHALPLLAAPRPRVHRPVQGSLASPHDLQHHSLQPPPPPPEALIASYLSCLQGRMKRMQPWQLSMCIFALLQLRARPEPAWMDAFLGQVYRTLPYMNEVQVTSVAWVVAKMSYRPHSGWMERLMAAAAGRLSCFSPRHLCQLLWAVAAMGYQPGGAWMARWYDKARVHFRTCDGRTLAVMAWVAASLRQRPEPEWPQDLCEHMRRRLPYTAPRDVANILAALAALGHRPEGDWLADVAAHVRMRLPSGAPAAPGTAVADSTTAEGGVYSLQDISGVCYSLARMGYSPSGDWFNAVTIAAAQMALLDPAQVAAGGNGGSSVAADGDDDDDSAAAAVAAAAAAHAKHIALLTLALARHRRRPPPAAWHALLEGLYPSLPHASPQSLAVLLTAAASLRLPLPREHAGALLLASHRRMVAFSGRGLALVFRAFVELGLDPGPRWLGRLEEVVAARQDEERRQRLLHPGGDLRPGWGRREAGGGDVEDEAEAEAQEEAEPEAEEEAEEEEWEQRRRQVESRELRLTPAERCSMLWAAATLESSVLEQPAAVAATAAASAAPGAQTRFGQRGRPQLQRLQLMRATAAATASAVGGTDGYPPPPRWVRKPGSLRRPLRLAGLIAQLLPTDMDADWPGAEAGELEVMDAGPDRGLPSQVVRRRRDGSPWKRSGRSNSGSGSADGGTRRLPRPLTAYSTLDLALLCWALGRLHLRPRGLTRTLLGEVQRRVAAPGGGQRGSIARRSSAPVSGEAEAEVTCAAAAHTGAFAARELALVCWGLSRLGVWPSTAWQAEASAGALRMAREGELSPQDLATVLSALARWRRQPKGWLERLHGRQPRVRLAAREPRFNGGTRSGADAAADRQAAADRRAKARLRTCTAKLAELALADSARHLTQYGMSAPLPGQQQQQSSQQGQEPGGPAAAAAAAARDAVVGGPASSGSGAQARSGAGGHSARSLATLAWALANLGVVRRLPDPWVRAFMPVSLQVLTQLPASHRVTLLDSLSRLGLRPGRVWMEQAEQVAMRGGDLRLASSYRGLDGALRRMSEGAEADGQADGQADGATGAAPPRSEETLLRPRGGRGRPRGPGPAPAES